MVNAETDSCRGGLDVREGLRASGDTEASGNTVRDVLMDGGPVGEGPCQDLLALHTTDVADEIVNEVFAVDVVHDSSVQRAWLLKFQFADFAQIPVSTSEPSLVFDVSFFVSRGTVDRTLVLDVCQRDDGTLVVGASTLVVDGHEAIALEVGNRNNGLVNRKLSVVDTKSVTMGVWVGKEARLQDGVARRLEVGNEVGRRKSDLLDLGEVVLDVFVQHHLADGAHGVVLVRPDLGEIQYIVTEVFSLLGCHCLNVNRP